MLGAVWGSRLALCLGNVVLLVLLGALEWGGREERGGCWLRGTEEAVWREDSLFQESVDAAMEIFDYMAAQKVGLVKPESLDVVDRKMRCVPGQN